MWDNLYDVHSLYGRSGWGKMERNLKGRAKVKRGINEKKEGKNKG